MFAVLFTSAYFPLAIIIGKLDMKTNFQIEQNLVREYSPLYKKILDNQQEILKLLKHKSAKK